MWCQICCCGTSLVKCLLYSAWEDVIWLHSRKHWCAVACSHSYDGVLHTEDINSAENMAHGIAKKHILTHDVYLGRMYKPTYILIWSWVGIQTSQWFQCMFIHNPVHRLLQFYCVWVVRVVHPCAINVSGFNVLLNGRFENQAMYFLRHQTVPKHLGICLKEGEFPIFHTLKKIKGAFL